MSDDITRTEYLAPDGGRYRIRIVRDEDASSPREDDNPTVMHTFDSHWLSPDREPGTTPRKSGGPIPVIPSDYIYDGTVDMRRATRWVNLFGKAAGVLAIAPLERVQDGWAEGGLKLTTLDTCRAHGSRGYADGYIAITAESWEMCMGDSPLDGGPWLLTQTGEPDPTNAEQNRTPSVAEVMEADVKAYNNWVEGNYVGYIVEESVLWVRSNDSEQEMTTWQEIEDGACWGIDDADYALTEAVALLPDGTVPA